MVGPKSKNVKGKNLIKEAVDNMIILTSQKNSHNFHIRKMGDLM
jgi:hypothetical protein